MKLQTGQGYPFDEVASALQKSIRRGLEIEAMYWAAEMETRYPDYLWKRLQIISVEDISIRRHAGPLLSPRCAALSNCGRSNDKKTEKAPGPSAWPRKRDHRPVPGEKSRIGDEF
jgi:hypothetical protein